MDIRTTAHNASTQAVMDRMKQYGCHLVEVSSHEGARPLCEPYQGRLFDMNNGSGEVEDLNGNRIHYDPWNSTSYGEPAGLLGINCGHQIYPFTPGYSTKRYERTADKAENDKQYLQSQQQRALERELRRYAREEAMLKKAGLDASEAHAKWEKADHAMEAFIEDTGLTRRKDREKVYGA